MNIRLFNKTYWIRRFGEQKVVKGYVTSGYSDFQASLHIHPLSTDQQQALPEGERTIKRLEGHGEIKLLVANQDLTARETCCTTTAIGTSAWIASFTTTPSCGTTTTSHSCSEGRGEIARH